MVRVTVRADVRPTEDAARVRAAILTLFPDARLREEDGALVGEAESLEALRDLVRRGQIPDAARGAMLRGLSHDERRASFQLGKQAAAAGRAHFGPVRGPLGEIDVLLEADEPGEVERVIFRVAPDTTVPPELAEVPPQHRPIV